jgi:hypothetical protein
MSTVESLEKCLDDLLMNRARLGEQVSMQTTQVEVAKSQLEHFDVLITSVRNTLSDPGAITKIDALLTTASVQGETANDPLHDAGAGTENYPAPAGENGQGISGQG